MIIDVLKAKYPDYTGLRVREITVDKQVKKVFCTVSLPDAPDVDAAVKRDITDTVKSAVPQGYYCIVSIRNDYFTELSFKRFILDAVRTRYPVFSTLKNENVEIKQEGNTFYVTFKVSKVMKETMTAADFIKELSDYCLSYTSYKAELRVEETDTVQGGLAEQEKLVRLAVNKELLKPARYFNITESSPYIGKKITARPMYIVDVREPRADCVICGVISDKSVKAAKNNPNLQICKFSVSDASGGKIGCILFARFQTENEEAIKNATGKSDSEVKTVSRKNRLANEKLLKKLMELYEGTEVLLHGKVVKSSFSGQLEMQVYDLAKCRIAAMDRQPKFIKPVPSEYMTFTPVKYREFRQISFTDAPKRASFLLRGKTFVVININASGLNPVKDKAVALSGAKIADGILTESFFTYINPEKSVSGEVLSAAKITTDKLPLYPTFTEIVGDVYKFCFGATLAGMDAAEILEFIRYYAVPVGYVFDNETVRQNDLISDLYDNSSFGKKANCSRLEDVAKSCRVEYGGSEFCADKSIAAARCIVRLGEAAV